MATRRRVLIVALPGLMIVSLATGLLVGRTPPAGTTGWGAAPAAVRAVMWPEAQPLADFTLITQHGEPFTPADLKGGWNLMFFGYLNCPDVCPTSLSALREMRRLLDAHKRAGGERYLFVSVDPASDAAADMAGYLAAFDPTFVGLSGSAADIRRLADSMAVKFETLTDERGLTFIDHTSSVMLIDPQGRMVGALPPPLVPAQMAERYLGLRRYLENTP